MEAYKMHMKTPIKAEDTQHPSHRKQSVCLHEAADRCLQHYFQNLKGMAPAPDLFERVMGEVEKPLLEHVLRYARGNQLRAAEILGINRNTLRKKIRLWQLDKPETYKE